MISGVKFGKYHSFYDLGLILSSVKIPPATPKTTYIDIPGADGQLDLTESLGSVKYQMREAEFTFSTMPGKNVEETKRLVSNALNGLDCNIIVEKDPEYYWQGRLTVSAYGYDYPVDTITIKATLKPYKLKHNLTVVNVSNITISASNPTVVFCKNECMQVQPIFVNNNNAQIHIACNGYQGNLSANTTSLLSSGASGLKGYLTFKSGFNRLEIYQMGSVSNCSISIQYQEGSL